MADYTYDAWGNQTNKSYSWWADENPVRYAGEYYDEESGLIYLRARYYDSSMGRFLSEDPIKDGVNWYAYCGNNPIMFVDPSGLAPENQGEEEFFDLLTDLLEKKVDYENTKDINVTEGADEIKTKIMNLKIINENEDLKQFIHDVIYSENGGTIQEVCALMFVVDYYMNQRDKASTFMFKREIKNVAYSDFFNVYKETKKKMNSQTLYYHSPMYDISSQKSINLALKWVDPNQSGLAQPNGYRIYGTTYIGANGRRALQQNAV